MSDILCVCVCGDLVSLSDAWQCFECMELSCVNCFSEDDGEEGICNSCNREWINNDTHSQDSVKEGE